MSKIYLSAFLFILLTPSLWSQFDTAKLDELKGYKELQVGGDIKHLAKKLDLEFIKAEDEMSGGPYEYYQFKKLSTSGYATIFESKVTEIKFRVDEEKVIAVHITFDTASSFQKLTSAFAEYLGTRLGCGISVMDPEYGGCYLEGQAVSFTIERMTADRMDENGDLVPDERTPPVYVGFGVME